MKSPFTSASLRVLQRCAGARRWWALAAVFAALATPVLGADWPQFRGPQRNGISSETGWVSRWTGAGPRQLWAAKIGQGYSSIAVKGARVYTMGNSGNRDTVYCLNADNGRVIWRHSYTCAAGKYGGTRATPTVDGANVYTISREAQAYCLNATTGKVVWYKDMKRELRAQPPRWGFAGSPLVSGKVVIYNVGSAGAGLDKKTGRVIWKSSASGSAYASPTPYTVGSQKGVAIFTAAGLVGLNPATGRAYWQHPWRTQYDVNAADPVFTGNYVFITSDYNKGCALLNLSSGRPKAVWQNRDMRSKFHSSVIVGGAIYGNDMNTLKCLDLRTGALRWQQRGLGRGGLMAADGKLIVLTERGELQIIQATPTGYTQLGRAQMPPGAYWTQPVLANGRIYCRSHEGNLICVDVRARR